MFPAVLNLYPSTSSRAFCRASSAIAQLIPVSYTHLDVYKRQLLSRLFFSADQATERFGAAFSNAGFIGIPLVQMTFGNEAVFYVSSFVALLNIDVYKRQVSPSAVPQIKALYYIDNKNPIRFP